jgi:hypothetical protein
MGRSAQLSLWLLVMGVNVERWRAFRASAAARD